MRTVPQTRCPNCDDPGSAVYAGLRDKVYGAPGLWNMRRCGNARCGALWLDPAPDPEDLAIAYRDYHTHAEDAAARPGNAFLASAQRAFVARRLGMPVAERWPARLASRLFPFLDRGASSLYAHFHLPARPGASLLEIGCGAGAQLQTMARDGWIVRGVDFDPEAVAVARRRGLDVSVGDVRELDFADGSFDAVVMAQVIEHVYDPVGLLARCASLLRPGGILVAITPNADSLGHRRYRCDWRGLEPPRHLVVFTARALRFACERAGLRVERVDVSARDAAYLLQASDRIRSAPDHALIERPRPDRRPPLSLRLLSQVERAACALGLAVGEELVLVARR